MIQESKSETGVKASELWTAHVHFMIQISFLQHVLSLYEHTENRVAAAWSLITEITDCFGSSVFVVYSIQVTTRYMLSVVEEQLDIGMPILSRNDLNFQTFSSILSDAECMLFWLLQEEPSLVLPAPFKLLFVKLKTELSWCIQATFQWSSGRGTQRTQ